MLNANVLPLYINLKLFIIHIFDDDITRNQRIIKHNKDERL